MSPRTPKSRPVKGVPANTARTQLRARGKRKLFPDYYDEQTKPSYFQASDPKNVFFDPLWYQKSLIPESDPWYSIVVDFDDGKSKIQELLKDKFELRQYISMDQVESSQPFDVAEIALGWAYSLIPQIEEKISFKIIDAEFLLLWGEYQKNMGTASSRYAQLLSNRVKGKFDRGLVPRQIWCAQFLHSIMKSENVQKKVASGMLSRLVADIIESKRQSPSGFSPQWFKQILHKDYFEQIDSQTVRSVKLGSAYDKELKISHWLELAKSASDNVPPVGFEHYPEVTPTSC